MCRHKKKGWSLDAGPRTGCTKKKDGASTRAREQGDLRAGVPCT